MSRKNELKRTSTAASLTAFALGPNSRRICCILYARSVVLAKSTNAGPPLRRKRQFAPLFMQQHAWNDVYLQRCCYEPMQHFPLNCLFLLGISTAFVRRLQFSFKRTSWRICAKREAIIHITLNFFEQSYAQQTSKNNHMRNKLLRYARRLINVIISYLPQTCIIKPKLLSLIWRSSKSQQKNFQRAH